MHKPSTHPDEPRRTRIGAALAVLRRDAQAKASPSLIEAELQTLLPRPEKPEQKQGHVALVGAGPGDPELLTVKALKALQRADVILHDHLVSVGILSLANRKATVISVGKQGFGPSTRQEKIGALMVEHAREGAFVVRLKGGDPVIFGRLDEELEALENAGISWNILPGITAASAAAAGLGQSLTQRGRNASLRILTGHDMQGFAEQDWRGLAGPGQVAAIYMAKASARFVQGRLLMHGATPETPVSIVENASRADQSITATTLGCLADDLHHAGPTGPAILLYGLAPRAACAALPPLQKEHA